MRRVFFPLALICAQPALASETFDFLWQIHPSSSALKSGDVYHGISRLPVRAEMRLNPSQSWSALVAWEVEQVVSSLALPVHPNSPLRITDRPPSIVSQPHFQIHDNLDRLLLQYNGAQFDMRLGRQALSHGSGLLFNVSDIFHPLAFTRRGLDHKLGVDAVRMTALPSESIEMELWGVAVKNSVRESFILGRIGVMGEGINASLYGGSTYGHPTFALDTTGNIKDWSWFLEGFSRFPNQETPTVRVSAGLSGSLGSETMLRVESLWNHNSTLLAKAPSDSNQEWQFSGKWYAAGQVSQSITSLIAGSLSHLHNLTDGSSTSTVNVVYDASEKATLSAGFSVPQGQKMRVETNPATGVPVGMRQSEMGDSPWTLSSSLRMVF